MSYQPFYIASLKSGLVKNPEAFLIPEDAFPRLTNAYIWRDRIRRKQGYSLLGRLRRDLAAQTDDGAYSTINGTNTYDIFTRLGLAAGEPNASVVPGTAADPITIAFGAPINNTLTDNTGTGTMTVAGAGPITAASINYASGLVSITANAGAGPATATITMSYYPALPVMGIGNRELNRANSEDLIVFDTTYAYLYNTGNNRFEEWIPGTTWSGTTTDVQFFWTVNYWQDTANRNLFWATNFTNSSNVISDPIRYSNGVTWTDFAPTVGATCIDEENLGTITTPWNSFGPATTNNTPVIPNTVRIIIAQTAPTPDIVLTDDGSGNLSTDTPGRNDTGTITYATGSVSLTINPALSADAEVHIEYCYGELQMHQARCLIPYKDRFLAFNTFEGTSLATAVQFPQRLRYSQNGSPIDQFDGWRSDVPGRGGFIDAPTNEQIVSVAFIRDILIVGFERSTWQIRYTGNEILPFVWEKIDTEYGCEATFSTVQFDQGVLQIGRDAITVCNGNSVQRIDLQIPDDVGAFSNVSEAGPTEGNRRIHGIRDLNIQLVYWTYNDNSDRIFPNNLLVYNYITNSYAIWNDGFTALGRWYQDFNVRWQDLPIAWQDYAKPWNYTFRQQNIPLIIGGNQQGFVEIFNQKVVNDVSLQIEDITGTNTTTITSTNHNLVNGQIIRLRNIIGDATNQALNDSFFQVIEADANTFEIQSWNGSTFQDVTPGSTYTGAGEIEVCNNFTIASKRFNALESGTRIQLGFIDFLCNTTANGEFTCQIFVDENDSSPINTSSFGEILDTSGFFNSVVSTSPPQFEIQGATKYWQRFYCQTDSYTYQYVLTLSTPQIVTQATYESELVIQALILWISAGGKLVR